MAKDRTISRILNRSRDIGGLRRAMSNRRDAFSVDYTTLMDGTPADTGGGGGGDEFVLQLGGLNLQLGGQDLTLGA